MDGARFSAARTHRTLVRWSDLSIVTPDAGEYDSAEEDVDARGMLVTIAKADSIPLLSPYIEWNRIADVVSVSELMSHQAQRRAFSSSSWLHSPTSPHRSRLA